jgi:hypothetical protein
MKHQYFGDVNDYVKYGLLRYFAGAGFRLGICWMLTPGDQRSDGRKIKYLSRPETWGHCDPDLFALLSHEVPRAHGRHFRHIETKGMIPNALFFGDIVPLKATNVLFLLAHRASDRPRVRRVIRLIEEKWSPRVYEY